MSPNTNPSSEREEIEMLMPWYVTGKLGPADMARVDAFLAAHPDERLQLDLIREEQDETIRANEAIAGPSVRSVDALMARVAASGVRKPASAGLLARLASWWENSSGGFAWATATAAGIVLIQAAVIAVLLTRSGGGDFQTASGSGDLVEPGSYAIVRFSETATVDAIAATLSELDMTIVDGPKGGGLFTVRIGPETMDADGRAARIDALRQDDAIIDFATVAP